MIGGYAFPFLILALVPVTWGLTIAVAVTQ